TPADVRERLDLDLPALEQLRVGAGAFARAGGEQKLEVVEDRLHPRVELLVDVAGQEANVAPERHDGARDEDPRVRSVFDRALQARCEREQRLARARLADESHETDRLVEQEIERERL